MPHRHARRPFRPCLELLENRSVPAVATMSNGILTIKGDARHDVISITDNGTNEDGAITVSGIDNTFTFRRDDILPGGTADAQRRAVVFVKVDLGGGNDAVIYRLVQGVNVRLGAAGAVQVLNPGPSAPAGATGGRYLDMDLGAGNDAFDFQASDPRGIPFIVANAYLVIVARGYRGDDALSIHANALVYSARTYYVSAGFRGEDTITTDVTLNRLNDANLNAVEVFLPPGGVEQTKPLAADRSTVWVEVFGMADADELRLLLRRPADLVVENGRQTIVGDALDQATASLFVSVVGVPADQINRV